MRIRKFLLIAFTALTAMVISTPSVFADEHEKACKADSDCAHGEHCKDGHCHQ